ncbi:hypothetical protein B0H10DRAFT_2054570 [Mycena sp. CBHHK59/15]|nr:hypothetical protein B0H10DRAFT_2054570 [Mycena sp. CBHHK59/15]
MSSLPHFPAFSLRRLSLPLLTPVLTQPQAPALPSRKGKARAVPPATIATTTPTRTPQEMAPTARTTRAREKALREARNPILLAAGARASHGAGRLDEIDMGVVAPAAVSPAVPAAAGVGSSSTGASGSARPIRVEGEDADARSPVHTSADVDMPLSPSSSSPSTSPVLPTSPPPNFLTALKTPPSPKSHNASPKPAQGDGKARVLALAPDDLAPSPFVALSLPAAPTLPASPTPTSPPPAAAAPTTSTPTTPAAGTTGDAALQLDLHALALAEVEGGAIQPGPPVSPDWPLPHAPFPLSSSPAATSASPAPRSPPASPNPNSAYAYTAGTAIHGHIGTDAERHTRAVEWGALLERRRRAGERAMADACGGCVYGAYGGTAAASPAACAYGGGASPACAYAGGSYSGMQEGYAQGEGAGDARMRSPEADVRMQSPEVEVDVRMQSPEADVRMDEAAPSSPASSADVQLSNGSASPSPSSASTLPFSSSATSDDSSSSTVTGASGTLEEGGTGANGTSGGVLFARVGRRRSPLGSSVVVASSIPPSPSAPSASASPEAPQSTEHADLPAPIVYEVPQTQWQQPEDDLGPNPHERLGPTWGVWKIACRVRVWDV